MLLTTLQENRGEGWGGCSSGGVGRPRRRRGAQNPCRRRRSGRLRSWWPSTTRRGRSWRRPTCAGACSTRSRCVQRTGAPRTRALRPYAAFLGASGWLGPEAGSQRKRTSGGRNGSPTRPACGAAQVGAAVLGVRVKPTIKEVRGDGLVVRTLERSLLWEVQTPQARLSRWQPGSRPGGVRGYHRGSVHVSIVPRGVFGACVPHL